MIRLDDAHQAMLDEYLAGPVVEAQLRLESWRGGVQLGTMTAGAGTVRWDRTALGGLLDVDVQVDRAAALSPDHPLGPYGQVLRASWWWPQIGFGMPVGRWRIDMPVRRDRLWWAVRADPSGPARLRNQRWTAPPSTIVSGSADAQIRQIAGNAGVAWIPAASWSGGNIAATECKVGEPLLDSLTNVLSQCGGVMVPGRDSDAVIVARPTVGETPDWTVETPRIEAQIDSDKVANVVTVWYEVPGADGGDPTYVAHTEELRGGPRAVTGPVGRVMADPVRLDESVTASELRRIARQQLREHQLAFASITVTARADPRREVGDVFRAVSRQDDVDCLCRATAISLDADGSSKIEGALISGTVGGISSTFTDIGL